MDYEDAAKKLVTYSRAFAKGRFNTAYGLSVGEMPVLEYLAEREEGAIPSRLAKGLGYTRPRMTRILDSLAAKGFVEREADTKDRRRVIVRITDSGRDHTESKRSHGVGELARNLSELGEHDVSELVRVLERAYAITYNDNLNSEDVATSRERSSTSDGGADSERDAVSEWDAAQGRDVDSDDRETGASSPVPLG